MKQPNGFKIPKATKRVKVYLKGTNQFTIIERCASNSHTKKTKNAEGY